MKINLDNIDFDQLQFRPWVKWLGGLLIVLGTGFTFWYSAFVISVLYEWFLLPVGAPKVSFGTIFGAMLIWDLFSNDYSSLFPSSTFSEKVRKWGWVIQESFLKPTMLLGIGYLIKSYFL